MAGAAFRTHTAACLQTREHSLSFSLHDTRHGKNEKGQHGPDFGLVLAELLKSELCWHFSPFLAWLLTTTRGAKKSVLASTSNV